MQQRKYKLNEKVFDQITPNSAYWIGYLYGDGNCTCENKIRLACAYSDKELLYQFRDFVQSNDRPIKEILNDNCHNAGFEFRSWRIHNTIKKYELTKRKEHRGYVHPDLLQKEFSRDFVRGLFDADGCFYYDGKHKDILFSDISGRVPVLKDVKNILVSAGVTKDKKKIVKNGSIFRIRMAKQDTINLIKYLYGNEPLYYLRRKYGIAKSYLDRLNETGST